jgi:hypothetical protein
VASESLKGGTTTKIGTSMWVPAYRGNSVGIGEKKRKADRAGGRKVPSSGAPLDDFALLSLSYGLMAVMRGRPEDQRGGRRKQSRGSCWENLDRVCCRHCAGIAETLGRLGALGHPASSPFVFREVRLGKKRGTDWVPMIRRKRV